MGSSPPLPPPSITTDKPLHNTGGGPGNDFLAEGSAPVDSPEANVTRSIRLFCESAPDSNREEEVLHLPVIVEAAESSPTAAQAAAQQIKRYLSREFATKPHVQYNALMLVRILSDNPGPTFTRCFDQSFVKTVKELLRNCKDGGTQQILREALDSMEVNKAYDQGVQGLIAMWKKEKGAQASLSQQHNRGSRGPGGYQPRGMMGDPYNNERVFQRNQLPPAHELASRIEEARNTAKILLQLIQQSTTAELVSNGLAREFSERCQQAQKSMQVYINCDSPPPDDDTMLTLIETNEQLSLASSRFQRAILTARKQLGTTTSGSSTPQAMNDGSGAFTSPPAPGQSESLFAPAPTQVHPNGDSPVSPIAQQHARTSSHNTFQPPPGPPPPQSRHNYAASTSSSLYAPSPQTHQPSHQETSNPFIDPTEQPTNPPRPDSSHNNAIPPPPPTDSRPGIGPYHNSGITPSYMGRQASAADGLTMHGAGAQNPVEIDGYSTVGRGGAGYAYGEEGDRGSYNVSPVEERERDRGDGRVHRRVSRVDVAGTGGMREAR